MFIRLQPLQIPRYWDVIKFAAIKANSIKDKDVETYSISLLVQLLNGELQCLLSIETDEILKVTLIKFRHNEITGENFMYIDSIYGFKKMGIEKWGEEARILYKYAKDCNCTSVQMSTSNPLVVELALKHGMVEVSKNYSVNLT